MPETLRIQDHSVSYQIVGKGYPLVLLHGFTETQALWNPCVQKLQKYNLKIITLDLPGHGDSNFPSSLNNFDNLASWLREVLTALGIDSFYLAGHSMGGYLAFAFAAKYPEHLSGFALVHSTPFADSDEKKIQRDRNVESIEKYGNQPFITALQNNLYAEGFSDQYPSLVKESFQRGINTAPETLLRCLKMMRDRNDYQSWIKTASLPITAILGKGDLIIPWQQVSPAVQEATKAQVITLSDIGHMGMIENPAEITQSLLAGLSFSLPDIFKTENI